MATFELNGHFVGYCFNINMSERIGPYPRCLCLCWIMPYEFRGEKSMLHGSEMIFFMHGSSKLLYNT